MSELSPELRDKIERVAHLRVTGVTWAVIAKQFGYTNDDSARIALTHKHSDVWRAEYELARAKYLDEVEAEALLTQRSLLRSDDDRVKQAAAHSLLNHCRQLRAQKIEMTGSGGGPMAVKFVFEDEENHNGDAE